jgi:transposase
MPLIRKMKAFVETLGRKITTFFLPPYSQDRKPDEAVWKHVRPEKADMFSRR